MNKFTILLTEKARNFVESLENQQRARVDRYLDLFREYGTSLPNRYLKKLTDNIWELRPGDVRLFLGVYGKEGIIVHGIKKKSQKLPPREIKTAEDRFLWITQHE